MMAATSPAFTVRFRPRMISVPSSAMRACRFLISSILSIRLFHAASRPVQSDAEESAQRRQEGGGHQPYAEPKREAKGAACYRHERGQETADQPVEGERDRVHDSSPVSTRFEQIVVLRLQVEAFQHLACCLRHVAGLVVLAGKRLHRVDVV